MSDADLSSGPVKNPADGLGVVAPPIDWRTVETAARKPKAVPSLARALGFADAKERSSQEQRAEQALQEMLDEVSFVETPLKRFADHYSERLGMNVLLDSRALDDLGIRLDEPLSVRLTNVKFRSVLGHALSQLALTYLVVEEGLLITTQEEAETRLETRIYPGASQKEDVIVKVVAPGSWAGSQKRGLEIGRVREEAQIARFGDDLIVRQTQAAHREINQLLLDLERSQARRSKD